MSTRHEASATDRGRLHDEVFKLLPWYLNGTLSDAECAQVESHLSGCAPCQNELLRCSELDEATHVERESDWQPEEPDLDRMLERIVSLEPVPSRQRDKRFGVHVLWPLLPTPARWALVGQSLMIVALGAMLLWSQAPDPQRENETPAARFETLTTPSPTLSGAADGTLAADGTYTANGTSTPDGTLPHPHQIQIVFAEDVSEAELRNLLLGVRASIIAGPSKRGVYEIALEPSEALEPLLARLRSDARVRFAADIRGGTRP